MSNAEPVWKFVSGRVVEPLRETLAKAWLSPDARLPSERDALWLKQPFYIMQIYRKKAAAFLADPDQPYRDHARLQAFVDGMEVVK